MTAPTLGRQQAHGIPLLHAPGSRSERVRWTAAELDIPLDLLSPAAPGGERAIAHPLNKVPAIMVQGEPLFESLAICNWLADSHPHRDLGWRAGSWNRALHDQWTAFALTELEANLWHTARNKFVYPPDRRVPQVYAQNEEEALRALEVFDRHMENRAWLIAERFSLTDIFCGFTISWASMDSLTASFPNLENYLTRLLAMPNCHYTRGR